MTFLTAIVTIYAAIIGAALASFACVVSERSARGEPFTGGRSHCACGRPLRAWENIPVLGWVRTWGRARCCGTRIPARYVWAELAGAGAGALFGLIAVMASAEGEPWYVLVVCGVLYAGSLVGLVVRWTRPPASEVPELERSAPEA